MATTSVIQALPTSYGATVIQASTFNLPAGDYKLVDWNVAQRRVDTLGRKLFSRMPGGSVADPNVLFYQREDITGNTAMLKTLVAVTIGTQVSNRQALNTSSMEKPSFEVSKVIEDVKVWHIVQNTLTNLSTYFDALGSGVWLQESLDPEGYNFLVPANDYQRLYEGMAFVLKQNAGSTPTMEPFYAAVSGSIPV